MSLKHVRLKMPVVREDLERLEAGMVVTLDGTLYTGREGLYKRILDEGREPPCDLASISNVNFHCSPAATIAPDGTATVGAVTATASFRFSRWLPKWFALSGCKMIIGKGGMSAADYRDHFIPNGAVYLTTVGYGTGALLGRAIKRVRAVHWAAELGVAQAMWVLEVENFGPFIVDGDLHGNALLETAGRAIDANLADLYAGLKQPALRRYGETLSRSDDVI